MGGERLDGSEAGSYRDGAEETSRTIQLVRLPQFYSIRRNATRETLIKLSISTGVLCFICPHCSCEQKRDPEMHQTKKGNQWYFGMKAHVGVDSKTKLTHTALVTPANVADATVLPDLQHGEETRVWGDQEYRGRAHVIHQCAPQAQDHPSPLSV